MLKAAPPSPLALLLLLASPAGAATVLSVGDGDTLRVVDGSKRLTIRMACIDAPETVAASKDDAPAAGQAAITNIAAVTPFSGGGGLIQTTSG